MTPNHSANNGEDTFVKLLTEHQSSLRAFIYSLMPGVSGVSDVLQETNLTLWNKREKFQAGSNFTAWSFAVARYAVLEFRRKNQRQQQLAFNEELAQLLAFDEEDMLPAQADKRYTALEACLQQLSPDQRSLINLRYERETSLTEHARIHGKSAGALRVTLHHIRTKLRRCIAYRLTLPQTSL